MEALNLSELIHSPWSGVLGFFLVTGLCCEFYTMFSPRSIYPMAKLFVLLQILHHHLTIWLAELKYGKFYARGESTDTFVILSDKKHMTELSEASELSQRAVFAQLFGLKYTLHKINPTDHNPNRYRMFGRVMLSVNKSQFPVLQPFYRNQIDQLLRVTLAQGKSIDGWTSIKMAESIRTISRQVMSTMMFGESLANEPAFFKALRKFPSDVLTFTAFYQFTPEFLAPMIHDIVTSRGAAMHALFTRLVPICARDTKAWNETPEMKEKCILGILIDKSEGQEYWSPKTIAQALIGIWFAASHQPWIVLHFVIYELCKRPEYIDLLRQELAAQKSLDYATLERLPLLNSFIKETLRVNPTDKLAVRRKAVKPFSFSNGGPVLEEGAIACVSSVRQMRHPARYSDPETFDGFRFVPKGVDAPSLEDKNEENSLRFTEVSEYYTTWGFGSLACPGRFHVSLFFKTFVSHLVQNYDFRLEDDRSPRGWAWNAYMMPYESSRMLIRPRAA